MKIAIVIFASLCLKLLSPEAAEPILSLDAAKLSGANRPIDRWDSARQILAGSRPSLQKSDGEGFVRFDGKDDFLSVSTEARSVRALTIFILAAPRANLGGFSGLFGAAPSGVNDYIGGINIDFGPTSTTNLSVINVESAGSSGFADLLQPGWMQSGQVPFGGFHLFTVRTQPGPKGAELFIDGMPAGARPRNDSKIGLDEIVIGGRFYSNDPTQPPFAQGFFQGDLAALALYDQALPDVDREKIEQTLFARVAKLNAIASGQRGHSLESIANPPPIQMLVPGFTVHPLPVKVSNINNVRYRADGKLLAIGYDGRLHLLTDTDGDGLEDHSEIFWDKAPLRAPIGMELLPANDPRGDGVIIASKSKVSLILDHDRDGHADEEIIVASGWTELNNGVDALGVAIDPKDGSIYFSLGCQNFVDAYLRDPQGNSHYSLTIEHGTVQRVSKDFSKRETVCTGVRFLCGMGFNADGDLFATDQEGATWLPNGNPLDELLQIVPGRHYGFPPRHPKHLPNVIDEPAIMEYGPQHQSTVGMIFNQGVNGGPQFGPANWRGDAIICGESRGKLYRTKLVKTPAGYIADNQLIACLSMLTLDSCVSPQGDLVVSCHSGPPDWGSGPAGEGHLFKIRHSRRDVPQIAHAWAAAPDEFRIAFDRPFAATDWAGAKEKIRIEAGRYVNAGDRFESIRPGYQVVRDQMAAPRRWVDLQSLNISADQRTLILRVPRQSASETYAITLPTPSAWQTQGGLPQRPEMDIALTLTGVEAGLGETKIILPHANLKAARAFTQGSSEHEAFFAKLDKTGPGAQLTLRATIDTSNIFVPATQPGATLDWDIAKDAFAQRKMSLSQDFTPAIPNLTLSPDLNLALPFPLNQTGKGLTFILDDKERTIRQTRFHLPWSIAARPNADTSQPLASLNAPTDTETIAQSAARADVHGNWLHGRRLFFGQATCATCHAIRGEGVSFGPDLSNLVFRDRGSVLIDITQPSATINPDHTGYAIQFKDGSEQNALIRSLSANQIVLRLPGGIEQTHPRSEIVSMTPLKTSLMPEGLGTALSKEQLEDLLTFLLTNPLEPAPITRLDPPIPPARTRADLTPFLPASPISGTNSEQAASLHSKTEITPLRLLLCAGPKDHGIDEHDYPLWLKRWSRLLALADNVTVATNIGFPTAAQLAAVDVAIFYSANPGWSPDSAALLDAFQKRGGGLIYLHYAIEGGKDPLLLADRIGLAFSASAFRHGEENLAFSDPNHPITRGFTTLNMVDESYWALKGDTAHIHLLASSREDNQPRPQLWTREQGNARVFVSIPGHFTWTFDDPLYRVLILRAIAWTAHDPNIDRLLDLAAVGARLDNSQTAANRVP